MFRGEARSVCVWVSCVSVCVSVCVCVKGEERRVCVQG